MQHKRGLTSKKNKLGTSRSISRHKSRPRLKARPDSSNSFSTFDTSSTPSSNYEQSRHRTKRHGTRIDVILVLIEVILRK